MRQVVTIGKPGPKGKYEYAGQVSADMEATPKAPLSNGELDRGGWQMWLPKDLGVKPGWKLQFRQGLPWFVKTVEDLGDETHVFVTADGNKPGG